MAKKFYSEIRVIYADTDAMGIAYHGNYTRWFEIGRTEYLRELGFPYKQLEEDGIWLPVIELNCKYKLPAVYDDVLEIVTWVGEMRGATIVMEYEIKRKSDGELLVTGHTKHGITDHNLKPVRIRTKYPKLYDALMTEIEGAN